tara:strand:+ start:180 stop:1295 length:1116 start_codon:yes stop_codon:yes gene_type:complete
MKNGTKLLFLFTFIFTLFLVTENTQAHSGRTDGSGGHTCRTNCEQYGLSYGEYHYHGGRSGGGGIDRDAFYRAQCEIAIEKDPSLISVSDNCLSDYGKSVKQKSIEERDRRLEEERLLRLKKQRENNISNWVVFLSLLLSFRLYQRNSEYYKSLFVNATKSGSWVFFVAVYFLNKRFTITFDWNGADKLKLVFICLSSILLFKYLEDNLNLSNKFINLRVIALDVYKTSYRAVVNLLEKLKIFKLINLIFIPIGIFIKILNLFFSILRKPFGIISSFIVVIFTSSFSAVFYGIFGVIVFSTISFILINLFSLNFEFVASLIFTQADVSGLNEIATLLSCFAGFIVGFIYYFIKNRNKLKENFLDEYNARNF